MNRVGVTNVEMSEREQMRLLDKKKTKEQCFE